MLHASPDGGVAVSILGPVSAQLPSGVAINVATEYPFDDDVTVTLSGLPAGAVTYPLYIRIPSWATGASGPAPGLSTPRSPSRRRTSSSRCTVVSSLTLRAGPSRNGAATVGPGP